MSVRAAAVRLRDRAAGWMPRSSGAQLTLLLLSALAVSQLITVVLLSHERRAAAESFALVEVLRQATELANLLSQAPPSQQTELLRAAGNDLTVFAVSEQWGGPWVPDVETYVFPDLRSARLQVAEVPQDRVAEWSREQAAQWLQSEESSRDDLRPAVGFSAVTDAVALRLASERVVNVLNASGVRVSRVDGGVRSVLVWEDLVRMAARAQAAGVALDVHFTAANPQRLVPPPEIAHSTAALPQPVALAATLPLGQGRWLNVVSAQPQVELPSLWPTLLSTGLMALAIVALAAGSLRRITRPLRALAVASETLGRGEAPPLLEVSGPIEVRQAASAFNAMQDRLMRSMNDRTRLLAAISHDLRTPITQLRLQAEFVEDGETRDKIIATLDEMQHLTETTLAYAREDQTVEPSRIVDLGSLVESLVADLADLGLPVTVERSQRIARLCRPRALKRAVRNLIENAVHYGGVARVGVLQGERGPHIVIDDDGPGIPEKLMEQAFEPFVKLDAARADDAGHAGIGLAIARSIARGHGGDVWLENRAQGGLRATLWLPD